MIKYTSYQLTKDRKIGIEVKAWERGPISGVIEVRSNEGMMIRRHFSFAKSTCKHLTEEQFLHHIINNIKAIQPYAKQVVGNVTVVH
ncbi:TPA: hypothetical protein QHQ05_004456 [Escherichia coli]|nr:hypothetical protein [Escherichia coli]